MPGHGAAPAGTLPPLRPRGFVEPRKERLRALGGVARCDASFRVDDLRWLVYLSVQRGQELGGYRHTHASMRALLRRLSSAVAILVMVAAVAVPALADDVSGTYRILTATGKHMIVTLIQHEETIEGYYVGMNVAGRLTAKIGSDYNHITYTWVQREGDSGNDRTLSGWGNMTFNDQMTVMKTAWGYDGQGKAVGFWTATLINP